MSQRLIDRAAFEERAEGHRHELTVHCYRMLGSPLDAEDAVQEALLRAYRARSTFTREISFRAWLYKIATNVCLDALHRRRRTLPTLAFPPLNPGAALPEPITDPLWVEPAPDRWLDDAGSAQNPAQRFEMQESVALAFVAALQLLPPRQRAVLILRDVLNYQAKETARLLDITVPAANSALHRARVKLKRHYQSKGSRPTAAPVVDDTLLERYVQAWEAADVDRLVALLQEDASLSMPPWPVWVRGHSDIRAILLAEVFRAASTAPDRLLPVGANGQPGFALYRRVDPDGPLAGIGIQLLTLAPDAKRIAAIDIFLKPQLFSAFRLPDRIED